MAFWKMAGLEVMPTIPSSIIRCSPPFCMSSRESSSTQGACPSSCIFRKRSFTSTSLCDPPLGASHEPFPSVYTRPARRYGETSGTSARPPVAPSDARGLTTLGKGSNHVNSGPNAKEKPGLLRDPAPVCGEAIPLSSIPAAYLALSLENVPDYQRPCIKASEWNVLEVFFIDIHLVALAAPATAAIAASAGGGSAVVGGVAGPTEELDVVRDDIDGAPLRAVLGLPGAVLQPALDEDRVALLLVVGDGLPELAPGGDVEEVHLLVLGAHAVDREAEATDRHAVVGEPELGISRKIAREYDAAETDHFCHLFLVLS